MLFFILLIVVLISDTLAIIWNQNSLLCWCFCAPICLTLWNRCAHIWLALLDIWLQNSISHSAHTQGCTLTIVYFNWMEDHLKCIVIIVKNLIFYFCCRVGDIVKLYSLEVQLYFFFKLHREKVKKKKKEDKQ